MKLHIGDILSYKGDSVPFYVVTRVYSNGNVDFGIAPNRSSSCLPISDVSMELLERANIVLLISKEILDSPLYKALNEDT